MNINVINKKATINATSTNAIPILYSNKRTTTIMKAITKLRSNKRNENLQPKKILQ